MDAGDWAAIICSLAALLGVVVTSRNARKAQEKNTTVVSATELEKARLAAETAAYERARKMDVETITRQDKEIAELREQLEHLNADVKSVNRHNEELTAKNERLERHNEEILQQNREVLVEARTLRQEVARLRQRLTRAERGMDPNGEAPIQERAGDGYPLSDPVHTDTDPMMREVDYADE